MHTARILPGLIAVVALMIACGDDARGGDRTTSTTVAVPTTTGETVTTTGGAVELEQPAIWPAAEVRFETPVEAAASFVTNVLGVEPVLGEFTQGDSRSGEIQVFSPGESTPVSRGLLFLRQLGPNDGWFVIGGGQPQRHDQHPRDERQGCRGPAAHRGCRPGLREDRGGHRVPGRVHQRGLDQVITTGGASGTPEPYRVTVDLTGASPGDVIALLVRGDTGLETDPGEFGAIPVVVG